MKDNIKLGSNRSFGIVFFIFFLILGLYPLVNNGEIITWFLLVSFLFFVLGIINSKLLTPLNKLWFKFGIFLGKIISPLIMMLIFFLVVTPIGLFMRIIGRDLLGMKFNRDKLTGLKKGLKSKMKINFNMNFLKEFWEF